MKGNKKGITLIVLVITIVVGLILVVAGVTAVSSAVTDATKASFAEELKLIEDEVNLYYLQNNDYPGVQASDNQNSFITYSPNDISSIYNNNKDKFDKLAAEMKENKENGDEEVNSDIETRAFYVIDLDKLNLDRKARGTKYSEENNEDVYVVSAKTNKVYYLKGVKTGGETYFSLSSKLINYVNKSVTPNNEGNVEVTQVGSLTVKRLKKTWTNTLGITLSISETSSTISVALKNGDSEIAEISNISISQNEYIINSLDDLPGANFTNEEKSNFNNSLNKKIEFTKGKDTLVVDVSNYDVNAPTYDDINTWTVTQTNEENIIEFKVTDDVSGVKEIRYAYLTKYGKEAEVENYYKNVENLEASFIKARGKKAEISEDGNVVLKVPRDIEAIQIVILDKAGNYPVDGNSGSIHCNFPIVYGIKADYIGCSLESINNNGLTFKALLNSEQTGNYISNYSVNVSLDGKEYNNDKLDIAVGENVQIVHDLIDYYKDRISIIDKVYVKITGTFKNENEQKSLERVFEFSLSDNTSYVTVKEVPTVGETLTLSVENPKEGATYYWTDMEDTLNVEGTELTLNEAEVLGYEGKQLYYIEKLKNKITTSDLYIYKVNYDISTPEQMIGIYKILSENVTYSQDTDKKIATLEEKTIRMLNDIDMTTNYKDKLSSATSSYGKFLYESKFSGVFDGQGKKFTTNQFLFMRNNGIIKNLTIGNTTSYSDIDSFCVGLCSVNYGTIENCINEKELIQRYSGGNFVQPLGVAGIVQINYGVVKKCLNKAEITIRSGFGSGGICGQNYGTIEDCINNGKINRDAKNGARPNTGDGSTGTQSCGGIAGISTTKILRCSNYGNFEVLYNSQAGNVNRHDYFGGICGSASGSIVECSNYGSLAGAKCGGICGSTFYKREKDLKEGIDPTLRISYCKVSFEYNSSGTSTSHVEEIERRREAFVGACSVGNVYINYCYSLKDGYGLARYDTFENNQIDIKLSSYKIYISNCYAIDSNLSNRGYYNAPYYGESQAAAASSEDVEFSNVYTQQESNSYSLTEKDINYDTSSEHMKTQEFCNKLSNNQTSENGDLIFKFVDSQEYPALYWE